MKSFVMLLMPVLLFISCGDKKENKELSPEEKVKLSVQDFIKKSLRDPESFKVYRIYASKENKDTFVVLIDYGAKNGFGGMERAYEKYKVVGNLIVKVDL